MTKGRRFKRIKITAARLLTLSACTCRGAVLSAIHGAAAERSLLASGAAESALANPELLRLPEGAAMPDAARAARILKGAEDLLFNLRFNVGEELALRNFALQANAPAE